MQKFAFILPPTVELLDLSGPAQVFAEAKFYGLEADIEFYQYQDNPVSTAGLGFGKLPHFKTAKLKEGDFVFVPGMDNDYVNSIPFKAEREFFNWLKECSDKKITVCSIGARRFIKRYRMYNTLAEGKSVTGAISTGKSINRYPVYKKQQYLHQCRY